jgi:hypothetical protein
MTKLEIITKAFATLSDKSEIEMKDWADQNMSPGVKEKLDQEVSPEEEASLLAQLQKDPGSVVSIFMGSFHDQDVTN